MQTGQETNPVMMRKFYDMEILVYSDTYQTGYMSAFLLSAWRPFSISLQHNLGMCFSKLLHWPYCSQSGLITNFRDTNKLKATDGYKKQTHSY